MGTHAWRSHVPCYPGISRHLGVQPLVEITLWFGVEVGLGEAWRKNSVGACLRVEELSIRMVFYNIFRTMPHYYLIINSSQAKKIDIRLHNEQGPEYYFYSALLA